VGGLREVRPGSINEYREAGTGVGGLREVRSGSIYIPKAPRASSITASVTVA
jgi:hypothetical protein